MFVNLVTMKNSRRFCETSIATPAPQITMAKKNQYSAVSLQSKHLPQEDAKIVFNDVGFLHRKIAENQRKIKASIKSEFEPTYLEVSDMLIIMKAMIFSSYDETSTISTSLGDAQKSHMFVRKLCIWFWALNWNSFQNLYLKHSLSISEQREGGAKHSPSPSPGISASAAPTSQANPHPIARYTSSRKR